MQEHHVPRAIDVHQLRQQQGRWTNKLCVLLVPLSCGKSESQHKCNMGHNMAAAADEHERIDTEINF